MIGIAREVAAIFGKKACGVSRQSRERSTRHAGKVV